MPERNEWPPRRPEQDLVAELTALWKRISAGLPSGGAGGRNGSTGPRWSINPFTIFGLLVFVWLASGIYIVAPDERGIVLRFGKRRARERVRARTTTCRGRSRQVLKPERHADPQGGDRLPHRRSAGRRRATRTSTPKR